MSKAMNPEAQEVLDAILKKEIAAMTSDDKAFLRARRGYLTKAQTEEFEEVLAEKVKVVKKEVKEEVEE